jgi:hypothetical protein
LLLVGFCLFVWGIFIRANKKQQLRKEKGNTQGEGVFLKLALALGGAKGMLILRMPL